MTVKQLIAVLGKLPQGALVVLQKDSEGNGYSPALGAEACVYRADSTWSGRTVECNEDDPREKGDRVAVVLWPVN